VQLQPPNRSNTFCLTPNRCGPVAVLQDPCLNEQSTNGQSQLCGTTPHLTTFAILLSGGGNTGSRTDQCTRQYVTGSSTGDVSLVASLFAAILLVIVIVVILSYTRRGRILISGREGMSALRRARAVSEVE
jgi:hypothetical protein